MKKLFVDKDIKLLLGLLSGKSDDELMTELKCKASALDKRKVKLGKLLEAAKPAPKCATRPPGGWDQVPTPPVISHVTSWRPSTCRWCGAEIQIPSWERDLEVGESGGGATEPSEWGTCSEKCLMLAWERDTMRGDKGTSSRAHQRTPWEAPQ